MLNLSENFNPNIPKHSYALAYKLETVFNGFLHIGRYSIQTEISTNVPV